jgi:hypothetical protein
MYIFVLAITAGEIPENIYKTWNRKRVDHGDGHTEY